MLSLVVQPVRGRERKIPGDGRQEQCTTGCSQPTAGISNDFWYMKYFMYISEKNYSNTTFYFFLHVLKELSYSSKQTSVNDKKIKINYYWIYMRYFLKLLNCHIE